MIEKPLTMTARRFESLWRFMHNADLFPCLEREELAKEWVAQTTAFQAENARLRRWLEQAVKEFALRDPALIGSGLHTQWQNDLAFWCARLAAMERASVPFDTSDQTGLT